MTPLQNLLAQYPIATMYNEQLERSPFGQVSQTQTPIFSMLENRSGLVMFYVQVQILIGK